MYVINASELRKQSQVELRQTLSNLLKEKFKLQLLKSGPEFSQFHNIKEARRSIARVETILRENKQQIKGVDDE